MHLRSLTIPKELGHKVLQQQQDDCMARPTESYAGSDVLSTDTPGPIVVEIVTRLMY